MQDYSELSPKEIRLSPWQSKIFFDETRYKVINCGRRAGKSTISSIRMLQFATENESRQIWYVAPTYKQAKSIMWAMLGDLIPPQAVDKKNETELSISLINGSQIYLKGAENADSLRGVRIDFCIFDECAFISKWDEVWKVMRPTLADSKAECWFISTPNGFNHFKELAERDSPEFKYFHFTTYDNPYIPREEVEAMKMEMDDDSFQQEIMGEFRKMSGLIYKDFNRDVHMVDIPRLDYNWTYTRAIDFGFGHKTALGYFAINSTGTEIYCYDGLYQPGLTAKDIADVVKIKDQGRSITNPVADSAQPMIIEELSREGVHFNSVEKGPDSVKNGITKVAEMLKIRNDTGRPTLMFAKHLTWIADEFEKYRWVENKSGGYVTEVPLKREDDAADMIRYMVMSYNKPKEFTGVPNTMRIKKWSIG